MTSVSVSRTEWEELTEISLSLQQVIFHRIREKTLCRLIENHKSLLSFFSAKASPLQDGGHLRQKFSNTLGVNLD